MKAILSAVFAAALVLALAACGGSSSSSTTSTTSTTTTTTASTGDTGGKLSAASWAALQADAATARATNQEAIKTFQKCRREVAAGGYSNQQIATCFGTETTKVVAAGQKLNADLAKYQAEAGGACDAALGKTQSQVTLYISSVNAIGLTVKQGQIPTTDDIDSTAAQLAQAQATAKTIAPACAPA